jgi:hypothetical protein
VRKGADSGEGLLSFVKGGILEIVTPRNHSLLNT